MCSQRQLIEHLERDAVLAAQDKIPASPNDSATREIASNAAHPLRTNTTPPDLPLRKFRELVIHHHLQLKDPGGAAGRQPALGRGAAGKVGVGGGWKYATARDWIGSKRSIGLDK